MRINDPTQFMRRAMVDTIKRKTGFQDAAIEAAFLAVPRHKFLRGVSLEAAYDDEAIPIKRDTAGIVLSASGQPGLIAQMLRQLDLKPGHNVLEIGTGSGYTAALIQHLVGEEGTVTTLELDRDLVEMARTNLQAVTSGKIRVVRADGAVGYAPRAAYDRIYVGVGVWDLAPAWSQQLKPRGRLVAPLAVNAVQFSGAFEPQPDGSLLSAHNLPCGIIPLRGLGEGPTAIKRVGGSSLVLTSHEAYLIDSISLHILLSEDVEHSLLDLRLTALEYWQGFVPYLMLNTPQDYIFAIYSITTHQSAYGLQQGHGFALIGRSNACFVPYDRYGEAHLFSGIDSFMALQDVLMRWDAEGRPGVEMLRVRAYPRRSAPDSVASGRLYSRRDHTYHLWQDKP